jgi:hypothetical protein
MNKEEITFWILVLPLITASLTTLNSIIVFIDNRLKESAERKKREGEKEKKKWEERKRTVKRSRR